MPSPCARLRASSNRRRAVSRSPSSRAISPSVCVAATQALSHSSVRAGGLSVESMSSAFCAQRCASCSRSAAFFPSLVVAGACWRAREAARLFISVMVWQLLGGISVIAFRYSGVAR